MIETKSERCEFAKLSELKESDPIIQNALDLCEYCIFDSCERNHKFKFTKIIIEGDFSKLRAMIRLHFSLNTPHTFEALHKFIDSINFLEKKYSGKSNGNNGVKDNGN